jgi:hypothetical protein
LQLTTRDRKTDVRRFALDVDPDEGDLALVDGHQLAARLTSVKYEYRQAGEFAVQSPELAGSRTSDWIVAALVLLLIGEQTLAYFASYHPAERTGGRR